MFIFLLQMQEWAENMLLRLLAVWVARLVILDQLTLFFSMKILVLSCSKHSHWVILFVENVGDVTVSIRHCGVTLSMNVAKCHSFSVLIVRTGRRKK
jgi:hypothetical protein